jgi:hypothetical protein
MSSPERFEIHLTLDADSARVHADALCRFAEARGFSLLEIELPRGAYPSQPMLGWRSAGSLVSCLMATGDVSPPFGEDVPRENERCAPGTYFESHVKLLLGCETAVHGVSSVALAHGAHMSRNARRTRTDGLQERFVTLRTHSGGLPEIARRTRELRAALAPEVHALLESEIEFVLHDSNHGLDAGWLPEAMP